MTLWYLTLMCAVVGYLVHLFVFYLYMGSGFSNGTVSAGTPPPSVYESYTSACGSQSTRKKFSREKFGRKLKNEVSHEERGRPCPLTLIYGAPCYCLHSDLGGPHLPIPVPSAQISTSSRLNSPPPTPSHVQDTVGYQVRLVSGSRWHGGRWYKTMVTQDCL